MHNGLKRLAEPHAVIARVGQRVVWTIIGNRRFTRKYLTNNVDVLPGAS